MDTQTYLERTGQLPTNDDLDRVNCEYAGEIGHLHCGWCNLHNCPRFECMCHSVNGIIKQAAEAAATA